MALFSLITDPPRARGTGLDTAAPRSVTPAAIHSADGDLDDPTEA
jgi:hypothetical protein